jgi:tripartite ATP-independent transporter DctM subunit
MIIAFGHTIWALILPVIILVGLRFGVFTPTEAGVVAVAYALIVGMVIYRELKIKHLFEIMVSTAKTSSIVIFLVACSMVTAKMLTLGKLPMQILDLLEPLVETPVLLLLMINLLVLVIGMAMDLIPIVLILIPVTMPLITAAGIHPVVFGLMFIFNACIGLLTPPVGAAMNVACGVGRINMFQFIRGAWPFLLVYVILLLAMILFPEIILTPLGWLTGK